MAKRVVLLLLSILAPSLLGAAVTAGTHPPLTADRAAVRVIDGDTLLIRHTVVQLSGIDAPELGQTCEHGGRQIHCGLEAAYALRKLVTLAAPPVTCYPVDSAGSADGATVASCLRGQEDLALTMLESGYAVAIPKDAPRYIADEAPMFRRAEHTAKQASMGIWGGPFTPPWQWRREKEARGRAGIVDPACVIKGRVDADGRRLYYGPLDDGYDAIAIVPAKGGRLFCSDDEARAAGWRTPDETPAE